MLKNDSFIELDSYELNETNGGLAPVIIAALIALTGVGFSGGITVGLNRKNRR